MYQYLRQSIGEHNLMLVMFTSLKDQTIKENIQAHITNANGLVCTIKPALNNAYHAL